MDINEAIKKRIFDLATEHSYSTYHLSLDSGISLTTLKYIQKGQTKSVKPLYLAKLCIVFGISLSEFFDCNYFIDLDVED